jgi:hypothetical protein
VLTAPAEFVMGALKKHDKVDDVVARDSAVLEVARIEGVGAEILWVESRRLFSRGDVLRVMAAQEGITGIVNPGKGMHYAGDALELARTEGANIFTFRQLMYALGSDDALPSYRDGKIEFGLRTIGGHRSVIRCQQECEEVLLVERRGLPSLRVVLTNIYTLGKAEVMRELQLHPGIDLIVNLSDYNQYTAGAAEYGLENGVRVISGREMFGVLGQQ